MEVLESIKKIEKTLNRYKHFLGLCVIILLGTLIIATVINFQKQNEIIKTGGFTEGDIKCVCNQQAWDEYQDLASEKINEAFGNPKLIDNLSKYLIENGKN